LVGNINECHLVVEKHIKIYVSNLVGNLNWRLKMTVENKLTMHELCKRIDNEFEDVDLSIHDSPTKGTVAVIYFYEDKLEEHKDDS